jgi:hypothetical protein
VSYQFSNGRAKVLGLLVHIMSWTTSGTIPCSAWLEVRAAQQEAPKEPYVKATQQEAPKEPDVRVTQQEPPEEPDVRLTHQEAPKEPDIEDEVDASHMPPTG